MEQLRESEKIEQVKLRIVVAKNSIDGITNTIKALKLLDYVNKGNYRVHNYEAQLFELSLLKKKLTAYKSSQNRLLKKLRP